jgi:hypothetical protein
VQGETGTGMALQIVWIARQMTRYVANATETKMAFRIVSTMPQTIHIGVAVTAMAFRTVSTIARTTHAATEFRGRLLIAL